MLRQLPSKAIMGKPGNYGQTCALETGTYAGAFDP